MMDTKRIEEEFGLSKLGFLPERCVERLPEHTPFIALENIANKLPDLNKTCTLEEAIIKLEIIPKHAIIKLNEGEQRRLYVILAMIIHSLLHGPKARWDLLDADSLTESSWVSGKFQEKINILYLF